MTSLQTGQRLCSYAHGWRDHSDFNHSTYQASIGDLQINLTWTQLKMKNQRKAGNMMEMDDIRDNPACTVKRVKIAHPNPKKQHRKKNLGAIFEEWKKAIIRQNYVFPCYSRNLSQKGWRESSMWPLPNSSIIKRWSSPSAKPAYLQAVITGKTTMYYINWPTSWKEGDFPPMPSLSLCLNPQMPTFLFEQSKMKPPARAKITLGNID